MTRQAFLPINYNVAGVIPINTILMQTNAGASPYNTISVQAVSVGTTGVVTPEVSNDGTNWVGVTMFTLAGATATTFNAAGLWLVPIGFRHFRLRLSTATTGGTTTISTCLFDHTNIPWIASQPVTLAAGTILGNTAIDAAFPNPVGVGARAANANPAAMSANGDLVGLLSTMIGAQIQKPYAIPEATWNANLSLTTTTAQALAGAAGAGIKRYITALQAINTGTALDLILLDGVTERWRLTLPQNVPVSIQFPTELLTTANTALNANLSAAGTVRVNAQGYTAP